MPHPESTIMKFTHIYSHKTSNLAIYGYIFLLLILILVIPFDNITKEHVIALAIVVSLMIYNCVIRKDKIFLAFNLEGLCILRGGAYYDYCAWNDVTSIDLRSVPMAWRARNNPIRKILVYCGLENGDDFEHNLAIKASCITKLWVVNKTTYAIDGEEKAFEVISELPTTQTFVSVNSSRYSFYRIPDLYASIRFAWHKNRKELYDKSFVNRWNGY